jgi:hypothetical protein
MTRISINIDSDAQQLARHLASAAVLANRMASHALDADNATLTAWLYSGDPAAQPAAFDAHYKLGVAINSAATVAGAILAQWGVTVDIPEVDVRSVPEKLADKLRAIVDGVVVDLPRPEPEPAQEPDNATQNPDDAN